jgi:enhancing lycopene biosynthesis protein 2
MKYGVILSGCGVYDGSEIHEAVATLYAIASHGGTAVCYAPDVQLDVIDHRTQLATGETRSVLEESARITRGEITDLAQASPSDFDALVLPGGFGAAKNLCTFAAAGALCEVHPEVERVLNATYDAGLPIGFLCISPALGARVFGDRLKPRLTIGTDAATADAIRATGAVHEEAPPTGIVVDDSNRIVSTPCYMSATSIIEVFAGADAVIRTLKSWATTEAAV